MVRNFRYEPSHFDRYDRISDEVDAFYDHKAAEAERLSDMADELLDEFNELVEKMKAERTSWTGKTVIGDANHPYIYVVVDAQNAKDVIMVMEEDGMAPYRARKEEYLNPDTLNYKVFNKPITIFDVWASC